MRSLLAALGAATLLVQFPSAVAAQTNNTVSDYGELPDVERAVISPSGDRIALITTIEGERVLLAIEDQSKALAQYPVGDLKIRSIRWIGDERILLVTSQTEDLGYNFTTDKAEFYIGRVLPIASNAEAGMIFRNRKNLIDAIVGNFGTRQIDGTWYGYYGALELRRDGRRNYVFNHGRPFLYRVNLEDFSTTRVANAAREGYDNDWVVDAQGNVAATLDVNQTTGAWQLRGPGGDRIAEGENERGSVWLMGLGYDGTSVLLGERTESSVDWYEYPLAGGERKPFLQDVDVDRLYFNDETGHLMGYLQGSPTEKAVFADPKLDSTAAKVRAAFSTREMRMIDWTSDLSDVIVRTTGNNDSGTWYAVDLETLRANPIAYERLAIEPGEVGPISVVEYTASDGTEMDGVLTLPPGREAKNLPVVMLPHGGPHSYDAPEFDWWAQAFAARGYAVFQPNFRGSTNRSQAFRAAGYGEWGRKMQTDKSEGLAMLAEKGIVDPERACIVGASYGGYAALAGVTVQQGLYRCAVAVAPVSDIKDMYQEDYRATGRDRTTKVSLLQQLGPRDGWDEVSPLRLAGQADAPVMLIHGKDDIVVPYSHSWKMADALKDAGKPYELVTLDGEDHWLSRSETRKQMLEASVRFVETHNPAD